MKKVGCKVKLKLKTKLKLSPKTESKDLNFNLDEYLRNYKYTANAPLHKWQHLPTALPPNTPEFIIVKYKHSEGFSILMSCNVLSHYFIEKFYSRKTTLEKWMRFEQ